MTPTDEPSDVAAAPAPATERLERQITVPDDDQDELDNALMRWSRELESEHGQITDFDVRPGDVPGLYIAAATVPARQHRRAAAPTTGGDLTPADEPATPSPTVAPARCGRCGSCGGTLPVRTGPGRRRRYCDDVCRSRAYRERNPAPTRCALRAGGWPCDQPAAWMIREPNEDHPSGWTPHGLKVAACEACVELVEQFAVRQPGVMFVARQPIADYRTEQRERRQTAPVGTPRAAGGTSTSVPAAPAARSGPAHAAEADLVRRQEHHDGAFGGAFGQSGQRAVRADVHERGEAGAGQQWTVTGP